MVSLFAVEPGTCGGEFDERADAKIIHSRIASTPGLNCRAEADLDDLPCDFVAPDERRAIRQHELGLFVQSHWSPACSRRGMDLEQEVVGAQLRNLHVDQRQYALFHIDRERGPSCFFLDPRVVH